MTKKSIIETKKWSSETTQKTRRIPKSRMSRKAIYKIMKKTGLTLVLFYIFIGLSAQTKITGFGKLKLGSPISIIDEMGYKVEVVSTWDDYFKKDYRNTSKTKIFELVADSTQEDPITSLDARVRVFCIDKYSVTDDIEIKSVRLKFFNNKLIGIRCDYNEKLVEALTLKYGEPKKDLKEEEHQFTYTYTGNTITKTDQTLTSEWQTNVDNVTCTSVVMIWYDYNGKVNCISDVNLSDSSYDTEIMKAEAPIRDRIKNRELSQKKQSLNEF